jgi:superoxide reductase
MTQLNQIYKCEVCGNIVEVLHTGNGELVCCGQTMILIEEQSEGEYSEKHAPVVEDLGEDRVKIKIGAVEHPMEEDHYIEWIEVVADGRVLRKTLKPGDKPEREFTIEDRDFVVRMYCNIHGLWKNK